MADFTTIKIDRRGAVARLTLSRPERANALNAVMLGEINAALDALERDGDVRVLIVTGRRRGLLLRLRSQGADGAPPDRASSNGARFCARTSTPSCASGISRRPTIAAVRGPCLAGACELALACDITIAADDAFFGEPELKFGAGIVAMLLPWVVGPKIAKEIIYTGEDRIPAARAREIGMVNRVVPAAELEATAFSIAEHIAAVDPNLVKETKRAINRAFEAQNMLAALEEALASTSPSKARARRTRCSSWRSPAATVSRPRSPGATRAFRRASHEAT